MVNTTLIETILREQDDPGSATTRQIRELYNNRSGENPILPSSDEDKEFQSLLLKALQALPITVDEEEDDDDKPISYTVKLKDGDDSSASAMKRRSLIKLPKEAKEQSESDEALSDSEKPSIASSITITKPFSPLFLNNMKKFGVSTDWLAKRSNLIRQSAYSRSSVESNTSKLDAMIKSASAKPVRSNRKLSFIENSPTKVEADKENTDPSIETPDEKNVESQEITKPIEEPTAYDLSSDNDEEKKNEEEKVSDSPPKSKDFSLRIQRVNLSDEDTIRPTKRSSSLSSSLSDDEPKQEKVKPKRQRKNKNETKQKSKKKEQITKSKESPKKKQSIESDEDEKSTTIDEVIESSPKKDKSEEKSITNDTKPSEQKRSKNDQEQSRIEHLKKLLRISGIRLMIKKTELDEFRSNKAKINYLKSLFDKAGFTGSLSIKECEKFRKKRDTEKELLEIQETSVNVKGHVKAGRVLRGQARDNDDIVVNQKRKRTASSEIEDEEEKNDQSSSDNEKPNIKKRRIMKMEASPEVSEDE